MKKINKYNGPYHWYLSPFFNKRYLESINLIKKYLNKKQNLIDVGCGDGRLTFEISKYVDKAKGLDYQEYAIKCAKLMTKDVKNLEFTTGSALNKLEEKFDVVTSFDVIEHIELEQVDLFLENCKKLMKDDGFLFLTTPNIRELRGRFFGHKINPKHYKEYTLKEMNKLFLKHNLKVIDVFGIYVPFPFPFIEHYASIFPLNYLFNYLIKLGKKHVKLSHTMLFVLKNEEK